MSNRCDPWFRMSGYADSDARVVRAGPMAEVLFYRILMYCCRHRSDGFIPAERVRSISRGVTRVKQRTDTLVALGLLSLDTDRCGYVVNGWLKYNKSQEAISADRARDAARKREQRRRSVHPDSDRTPVNVTPPTLQNSTDTESSPPLKGRGGEDSSGARPRFAPGAARAPQTPPQWVRDLADRERAPGKPDPELVAETKRVVAEARQTLRARENRRAGAFEELRAATNGAQPAATAPDGSAG